MTSIAAARPHLATALVAALLAALAALAAAAAPATALTTGPRVVGVPTTTTIDQVPWQVAVRASAPGGGDRAAVRRDDPRRDPRRHGRPLRVQHAPDRRRPDAPGGVDRGQGRGLAPRRHRAPRPGGRRERGLVPAHLRRRRGHRLGVRRRRRAADPRRPAHAHRSRGEGPAPRPRRRRAAVDRHRLGLRGVRLRGGHHPQADRRQPALRLAAGPARRRVRRLRQRLRPALHALRRAARASTAAAATAAARSPPPGPWPGS